MSDIPGYFLIWSTSRAQFKRKNYFYLLFYLFFYFFLVFSFLVFGCFDLGLWWGLLFQSLMNWSGHTIAANTGFRFLVGGWFNSRSNSIISILKSFLQELEWLDSTYVTTSEPGHRFTSTFVWFLFYFVHHFFFLFSFCLLGRTSSFNLLLKKTVTCSDFSGNLSFQPVYLNTIFFYFNYQKSIS